MFLHINYACIINIDCWHNVRTANEKPQYIARVIAVEMGARGFIGASGSLAFKVGKEQRP